MRFIILVGVFIAQFVFATLNTALAQAPDGMTEFYSGPTEVNMGGRTVIADIDLYADTLRGPEGIIHIALVTDVSKFVAETEIDLKNWVAQRQNRCGERWGATDPLIDFPPGEILFSIELEYELWNCGLRGRGEPGRLLRETTEINVTLSPIIIDGKLQAELREFSMGKRSGINKYFPFETIIRKIIESEIRILNKNGKFYKAPQPFHRERFVYSSIDAEKNGNSVIITARYSADSDARVFDRLANSLREGGIVSER